MMRADGPSDGGMSPEQWSRRRHSAMLVEQAAHAIRLRPGSDTVVGAQALIDALDRYWQVRYGGRVVIVLADDE